MQNIRKKFFYDSVMWVDVVTFKANAVAAEHILALIVKSLSPS